MTYRKKHSVGDNAVVTGIAALMLLALVVFFVMFLGGSFILQKWNNPFDTAGERAIILIMFAVFYIMAWDQ